MLNPNKSAKQPEGDKAPPNTQWPPWVKPQGAANPPPERMPSEPQKAGMTQKRRLNRFLCWLLKHPDLLEPFLIAGVFLIIIGAWPSKPPPPPPPEPVPRIISVKEQRLPTAFVFDVSGSIDLNIAEQVIQMLLWLHEGLEVPPSFILFATSYLVVPPTELRRNGLESITTRLDTNRTDIVGALSHAVGLISTFGGGSIVLLSDGEHDAYPIEEACRTIRQLKERMQSNVQIYPIRVPPRRQGPLTQDANALMREYAATTNWFKDLQAQEDLSEALLELMEILPPTPACHFTAKSGGVDFYVTGEEKSIELIGPMSTRLLRKGEDLPPVSQEQIGTRWVRRFSPPMGGFEKGTYEIEANARVHLFIRSPVRLVLAKPFPQTAFPYQLIPLQVKLQRDSANPARNRDETVPEGITARAWGRDGQRTFDVPLKADQDGYYGTIQVPKGVSSLNVNVELLGENGTSKWRTLTLLPVSVQGKPLFNATIKQVDGNRYQFSIKRTEEKPPLNVFQANIQYKDTSGQAKKVQLNLTGELYQSAELKLRPGTYEWWGEVECAIRGKTINELTPRFTLYVPGSELVIKPTWLDRLGILWPRGGYCIGLVVFLGILGRVIYPLMRDKFEKGFKLPEVLIQKPGENEQRIQTKDWKLNRWRRRLESSLPRPPEKQPNCSLELRRHLFWRWLFFSVHPIRGNVTPVWKVRLGDTFSLPDGYEATLRRPSSISSSQAKIHRLPGHSPWR